MIHCIVKKIDESLDIKIENDFQFILNKKSNEFSFKKSNEFSRKILDNENSKKYNDKIWLQSLP